MAAKAKVDLDNFFRANHNICRLSPGAPVLVPSTARCARWIGMCRSIKTLFNFEPPATDDEVRAASLQFVRKLSGFTAPSNLNKAVFDRAVEDVFAGRPPAGG